MSDWSSFKDDKKHMDAWRDFLSEETKEADPLVLNEILQGAADLLKMLGWRKRSGVEQAQVEDLAEKIMQDEKMMQVYFTEKGERFSAKMMRHYEKLMAAAGFPGTKANLLTLAGFINFKLFKEKSTWTKAYQADIGLYNAALGRINKILKGEIQDELKDPESELQPAAAGIDPKTGQRITTKLPIKSTISKMLTNQLLTGDQATQIFRAIDAFLKKSGFPNRLAEEFINEQTPFGGVASPVTGRGRRPASTRRADPKGTADLGTVIDLSKIGIKPESQAQVRDILNKLLEPYKLTVNTGDAADRAPAQAKPDTAPAQAEPDTAPAGAKPEAEVAKDSKDFKIDRLSASRVALKGIDDQNARRKIRAFLSTKNLPANIDEKDPLITGILQVVRGMVEPFTSRYKKTAPTLSPGASLKRQGAAMMAEGVFQKLISDAFMPIILEEIKRERIRRLIVKETQRVLNEKR